MSSIHVTTFVACWTPYLVISLWHIFDEKTVQNVSPIVQDILFLTAVLNSCLNPFVYGGFYVRNFRKQMRNRDARTSESYRLIALKRASSRAPTTNGTTPARNNSCAGKIPENAIVAEEIEL